MNDSEALAIAQVIRMDTGMEIDSMRLLERTDSEARFGIMSGGSRVELSYNRMDGKYSIRLDDAKPAVQIIRFLGFEIGIQYRAGDMRHGRKLAIAYGHIRGTRGEDGMALDCYVGPDLDSDRVFVVSQLDYESGEFDESKIMLAFRDMACAEKAFKKCMPARMYGGIVERSRLDLERRDGRGPVHLGESKYTPEESAKIGLVMREFAEGKLKSSSGEVVTNPEQAKAIAMSEAGVAQKDRGLPYQAFNMRSDGYECLTDEQRYEYDDAIRNRELEGLYTKAEVHYTYPGPVAEQGYKCFNCAYKAADSPPDKPMACVLVEGTILPEGICEEALIPPTLISEEKAEPIYNPGKQENLGIIQTAINNIRTEEDEEEDDDDD